LGDVIQQMRKAGIRAELDSSDDRMQKKVRNAQMQKIPFMVIAGEEDQGWGGLLPVPKWRTEEWNSD